MLLNKYNGTPSYARKNFWLCKLEAPQSQALSFPSKCLNFLVTLGTKQHYYTTYSALSLILFFGMCVTPGVPMILAIHLVKDRNTVIHNLDCYTFI